MSSDRLDKESSSTASELGNTLCVITRKLERDILVVTTSNTTQWTTNNFATTTEGTRCGDFCRCSRHGMGGVASRHTETAGYWKEEEKDLLINVRELKTIAFVPQHHEREFEGVLIKIFSNNITALKYAKKSREETASPWLQELALEVQEIVVKHNLQVQYKHIQSIKNIKADQLSRQKRPLYE